MRMGGTSRQSVTCSYEGVYRGAENLPQVAER